MISWPDVRAHCSADCGAVRCQASSETPLTTHHTINTHNHTINIWNTVIVVVVVVVVVVSKYGQFWWFSKPGSPPGHAVSSWVSLVVK